MKAIHDELTMKRPIRHLDMREATAMTSLLNRYGCEARLVNDDFDVDAKSLLGAIAATYCGGADLYIYGLAYDKVGELSDALVEFYD